MKTTIDLQGSECWIIGRLCRIEANGHEYPGQPFIVFPTEEAAELAAQMITEVGGGPVMIVKAAHYSEPRP